MSYEQAPSFFPEVPKDGKKRIFVERQPTDKARDVQIPRFRRLGYEEDKKYSNEDAVCMVIDEKKYNDRAKAREEYTSKQLLAATHAGVAGEQADLSMTKVLDPQNPEAFFDAPEA